MRVRAGPFKKKEVEMEVPNYSTKPSISRILLPRIIILLLLAGLLYAGARINFFVFNMEFPNLINYLIIILIIALVILDIILTDWKNKENKIYFFSDRIEIRGKEQNTINLGTVTNADVKKDMFDKMLKTGNIVLSNGEILKNLKYPERINQYIMQLLRKVPEVKKKI